ncbi:MAG TPA: lytic transglycosylase domain-containing protein [Candidatus Paceibacterota bacterium]|nr:lytic transglycosylase domain-containing protein [Candidatus Paceibacterota bacterium]
MKRLRVILILGLFLVAGTAFFLWREEKLEQQFFPQIKAAAERYGVDPQLVRAIAWRESRFHPEVRGRAGELGLMQIQEVAAQEWADAEHVGGFVHEHCLDPGTNTMAATFYLSKLLKRYTKQTDNPVPFALADYNAGRANAMKWKTAPNSATNSEVFIRQIGFPSTKAYVKSVMRRYRLYKFLDQLGL